MKTREAIAMERAEAIREHGGNLSRAARALGIRRATLRLFALRHGIEFMSRPGRPCTVAVRSAPSGLQKRCQWCGAWRSLDSDFSTHQRGAFGKRNICRTCDNARHRVGLITPEEKLAALKRHCGNAVRAAEDLCISRESMRRFAREQGIKPFKGKKPLSVQVRPTPDGLEKKCVKCSLWLPLDECFSAHKQGAFGRNNTCKACVSEARAARAARKRSEAA